MVHLGEQFLAPRRHAAADGGDHRVARQEITGGHGLDFTATAAQVLQRPGHVRVVLEAVVDDHLPAVMAQRLDGQAFVHADPGHFMAAHCHEQVVFMQHLVVLQVVEQGIGHGTRIRRQKHRRALHPRRRAHEHRLQEALQVDGILAQLRAEQAPPLLPGQHQREDGRTNRQREPASVHELQQIRGPERKVHHKKEAGGQHTQPQRVLPAMADDIEGQDGRDQHVGADRNAIGRRQVAGRLEHHHGQDNGHEQAPVHKRHVDLAGRLHIGVADLQARQVAQLDHLFGDREGAGNQCLRGNHRCQGGQRHQRQQRPVRRHHEEGILHRLRVRQQQRALTEVVQDQGRHDHQKPRQPDRLLAKVPQVGIQGLGPCHTQHHRAQDDEGRARLVHDEAHRIVGADGPQHGGVLDDVADTQHPQHQKPQQGDRPEELADAGSAPLLHHKQQEQDHQGDRDHVFAEMRGHDLHALHRRQHGNRRGDDTIAIKEAGAEDAQQQQHLAQFGLVFHRLGCQRQHRHQAAFAVVVGAQHQQHVFDRDDDRQRPDKDRQDAVDILRRKRHVAGTKDLLDGIQDTGSDVAIDNADGTKRKSWQGRFGC